eukprot:m.89225 g.89225  ORF g.89225 m.89225 type:complete len:83 (-) comp26277_c0_seq1:297-545(-)
MLCLFGGCPVLYVFCFPMMSFALLGCVFAPQLLKPTMNLFADTRQCTQFRRTLETERRKGASVREIVTIAMGHIDDEDLDAI